MAGAVAHPGGLPVTGTAVLAAVCGAVLATGAVLLARELVFPPSTRARPPARLVAAARMLWRGTGRGPAEQRRHRLVVATAALAGTGAWLVTGLPVLGLVCAAAVPGVPWLLAAGAAEKRAIARVDAVGEWTRRLRDVAGTGAGLQAAIVASAATAPAAVAEPVRTLAARLQAGWHAGRALRTFAGEIADPVCDQIVAALLLHLKDRGDKLGAVLSSIAGAAAKEVSMRKEADAERASARFSIRFMTGFSVVAVAVAGFSGDYMRPYATGAGQVLMAVLVTAFVGLLLWTRAMSRPAPVPRLLGPGPVEA
jgi:Flp pilus assembly protein TadB